MIKNTDELYDRIVKHQELVESDPYRLHYHIMPPVGLLNDPNGLVYFNGRYHVFYQWNPWETAHGAKYWGHYVSDDLVHWESAPPALAPDQWYDKNGCYSGSAVVWNDQLYVFYTGNVKDEADNRESYQCLAISEDGIHFEKKGPVIHVPEGYTAHFRDPKVFYHEDRWYMVLGAQTEELRGEAVIYTSADLENWRFHGPLIGSGHPGIGEFGYMWECPDLFQLGGKDILVACPQGLSPEGYAFQNIYQSGYFAGSVDYKNLSFDHKPFVELDRGFDFYAPQTMVDPTGRRILFGWMGNAEEKVVQPTVKHEWIHALTIPRELVWQDGRLLQRPVEELHHLRADEVHLEDVVMEGKVELPGVRGNVLELELQIADWQADAFTIGIGKTTRIHYTSDSNVFTFERNGADGNGPMESRQCIVEELRDIRIFKDTSSMEIFVNGGEEVFTSRVFDDPEDGSIAFSTESGRVLVNARKWKLEKSAEQQ
ncbi:glycoside hydrolase family 32 protein [Virgibacillus xinjiangensis]|uniref:Sucrose-6-phosphate hydrolase n=1 Tax=Virgibacillus xinjiangensis TaxID=393090 RepID=A0ABV7CX27_9BACI